MVQTANVNKLADKLKEKLRKFRDLLPPSPDQLEDFAKATLALHEASRAALPEVQNPSTRLMEEVQNAADTAETILNQPLEVTGASHQGVTLLEAAKAFSASEATSSDLAKISKTFSRYADSTSSLKVELEQTIEDLNLPK